MRIKVLGLLLVMGTFASLPAGALPPAALTLDSVCLSTTAGILDATRQAADAIPRDVVASWNGAVGTSGANYGDANPFSSLQVNVGQAGHGGELRWRYYSGNTLKDLDVSGGQFDERGWTTLSFTAPSDWTAREVSGCPGTFYYIKSSNERAYDIPPLLTQVLIAS